MNSWPETIAQLQHNLAGSKSRIIEDRTCNTSVGSNMEALREYGIVPSASIRQRELPGLYRVDRMTTRTHLLYSRFP
jgi:hypothetical protein